MNPFKKFFKIGFSAVVLVSLPNITSCNSGSKEDTIPVDAINSTTSTANSTTDSAATMPTADSSKTMKADPAVEANSKMQTQVVTIENMKFNPATITINKGDKVTFINKDIVAHNATETDNAWASPMLANGQSWTFSPDKTSDYYCTVHIVMKGKIIVK